MSRNKLNELSGIYKSNAGFTFKISLNENCLDIFTEQFGTTKICPISDDEFIPVEGQKFSVKFKKSPETGKLEFMFTMGRFKMDAQKTSGL